MSDLQNPSFIPMEKVKRYDLTHDPEVVRYAHKLFVQHRLVFRQIAGMLKRRFGIGAKVTSLADTFSRWARADDELWLREREEHWLRETQIRHEGEELIGSFGK